MAALHITADDKDKIKSGHLNVLARVVDENIKAHTKTLVMNKEDTRLYQGYLQVLLDIKEVLS